MCLNLKRGKGAQLHSTVLVIREAQLRWHLSATIFECHPQSQAIVDAVNTLYQSEKLIKEYTLTGTVQTLWYYQQNGVM